MKPITDEQLEILANEVDKMRLGEIVSLNRQLQQAQVIINEAGTAVFAAWLEVAQIHKALKHMLGDDYMESLQVAFRELGVESQWN